MKTRVAINGFGRIGRNAFKVAFDRDDIEVVSINDLTDTKTLAYLLKHDTNYGAYKYDVGFDDTGITVKGQHVLVLAEKDPLNLPWADQRIDVVIESTGFYVEPDKARAHITAGAKRVVISAPAKGDSAASADTIILGVNEDKLQNGNDIISNASCTSNAITPVAAVIENAFGIEKLMMTTVHSYTASQHLQDGPGKNLREDRAGAQNIVPTTTGASIAAAKALPALEGIFGGFEVRVPTPVVSLADFVIITKRDVTVDEVNDAFKKAVDEPFYQGILDVSEEELVSTDYIGNSHSAIIDSKLTAVIGGNMVKVVAWYDNEWGYSNRLVEVVADVGKLLQNTDSPASTPPQTAEAEDDLPVVIPESPESQPEPVAAASPEPDTQPRPYIPPQPAPTTLDEVQPADPTGELQVPNDDPPLTGPINPPVMP